MTYRTFLQRYTCAWDNSTVSTHTDSTGKCRRSGREPPCLGGSKAWCALSERERVGQTKDSLGPGSLRAPTDTLRFTKWDVLQGDGESWKPQDWERPQNVPEGEEAQRGSQHWPGQKRVGQDAIRDSLAVSQGREPSPGSWGDTRLARDPPKAKEYGRPASNTRNDRPTHNLDASLENYTEGKRPIPKGHTLYHSIYTKVLNRYNHRKRGQELRWGGVGGSHMRGSCGDRNGLYCYPHGSPSVILLRGFCKVFPLGNQGNGFKASLYRQTSFYCTFALLHFTSGPISFFTN